MRLTGLQAKMTASYVVVTAAAVLLVEAVAIGLLVPTAVSASDVQTRVPATAAALAGVTAAVWAKEGSVPPGSDFPLGSVESTPRPGTAQADGSGGIVVDRTIGGYTKGQEPVAVALLMSTDGTVLASSYPAQYPVGSHPQLPYDPANQFKGTGTANTDGGQVTWAVQPVPIDPVPTKSPSPNKAPPTDTPSAAPSGPPTESPKPAPVQPAGQIHGTVYVQVASGAALNGGRDLGPSLRTAALVLLLLLPVGAVFGYLSTRRTVRRVRRLEESTARVAAGDLDQRVDVAGRDELAGLESGFNSMAEQLRGSLEAERQLSGSAARAAERTRIARELHDSVSQDVFSLGLLAGGLRKALPENSPLRPEIDSLERTSRRALRELQALLLELRPIAMEDFGLTEALGELCRAYRTRLGIDIHSDIGALQTSTAVEHGVLRIAQEALANAVKHADPASISLSVQQVNGAVSVQVRDNGTGFDTSASPAGDRLGLGLSSMRQRITELGGSLVVESEPGAGTLLSVVLPAGQPQ